MNMIFRELITLALTVIVLQGCNRAPSNVSTDASTSVSAPVERGRTVYQTQCTACHNTDPHKPGSIGPDVFGSSKDLLEARLLKAEYPPNYRPKRTTHLMAPLPHLKNEVDSIYAYLNSNP